MNVPCAKCSKTVYPMEKLACLDKTWHKTCFKCTSCDMTLTMKSYKGYDKMPYCAAHYPSTKHTAISDTPESRRCLKNTELQSQIKYHKQFEDERAANIGEIVNADKNSSTGNEHRLSRQEEPIQTFVPKTTHAKEPERRSIPHYEPTPQPPPVPTPVAPTLSSNQVLYRCLFDYAAADDDEVSFNEGDIIENGEIIDEGWMTGRIQRTNQTGMIPYNYVQKIEQ